MEKPVKVSDHKWTYRGYEIHSGTHNSSKKGAKKQYRFDTYEIATQDEINKPMMFKTKMINNVMVTATTHYSFDLHLTVQQIDQIENRK